MIVDAHAHLLPKKLADAIGRWFKEHAGWDIPPVDVGEAIRTLRSGGVDRVVTLPYVKQRGMARKLNADILEIAQDHHPYIVPCCTVHPDDKDAREILEEALEGPFAGVKIHCHVMGVAPDDPRLDPVFKTCAKYKKPLVIHCGREPASEGYGTHPHKNCGAARLKRALEGNESTICIVPHLGWDEPDEFEAMLENFPNLYLDTTMVIEGFLHGRDRMQQMVKSISGAHAVGAGVFCRAKIVKRIVERWPDRILYGTDLPNLPYGWSHELSAIRALGLPRATEELLLGGNADRLFGITAGGRGLAVGPVP